MAAQELVLTEILDISAGDPLKAEMCEQLAKKETLTVNASRVRKISTPCVQVLIAAGIEAERLGLAFHITRPSSVFSDSFQNLGLSEYLDQWGN
ncbi:MAG: STAS domain-containing protein [Alphaproteobacteria bacterium]|nr:STAS domain-containing protein [Alphaproteobacteria bacterium]